MKGQTRRSFFAIAVLLALTLVGCQKSPTRVLTFRIDRNSKDTDPTVTAEDVASTISAKLNGGVPSLGAAKALDKDRVEVVLYGTNPEYLDTIKDSLTMHGRLDLRILATPIALRHRAAIEAANQSSADEITSADGKTARWVKVNPRIADSYVAQTGVTRENADGSMSVLVIVGPFDAHNEHFQRAVPTVDENKGLACSFEMTDEGALLLEQLTAGHRPDPATNDHFMLGIILNDELVSAPNINDVIKKTGIITGITPKQVEQMESILNVSKVRAALVLESEIKTLSK